MKRLGPILVATFALSGIALAQTPTPQSPPPAAVANDPSLRAFGDVDKTCLEWTDGCRTCQRVGDTGVCPNIGIACQPTPITCTRREEPPKPDGVPKQDGAPK